MTYQLPLYCRSLHFAYPAYPESGGPLIRGKCDRPTGDPHFICARQTSCAGVTLPPLSLDPPHHVISDKTGQRASDRARAPLGLSRLTSMWGFGDRSHGHLDTWTLEFITFLLKKNPPQSEQELNRGVQLSKLSKSVQKC